MKGGGNMATTLNRLTFAVTKEMGPLLDNSKYFDRTVPDQILYRMWTENIPK